MKRILSCLLVMMLLVGTLAPHVQAAEMKSSGNLANPSPTKVQIASKWNEVTTAKTLYVKQPSVSRPYSSGQLSNDFLQSGITYLNYIRYVANLPGVQLNDKLNKDAQRGAVLLAAVDVLTHYPSRPSGMDGEFYNQGYAATSSSNLSAVRGYEPTTCLQRSVAGCMADSSDAGNLSTVGHRRWFLNPKLLNVGFGYAVSKSGWHYTDTKIFDESGRGCDYNFISWPASGNHPTNLFDVETPWSITLNPEKYQTPQLKNLKITITRKADQKKWTFNAATGKPSSKTKAYLTVDNNEFGVNNCIIFHPGSVNVDAYQGVFTVDVTGLRTTNGKAAELHYQVDFFDVTKVSTKTSECLKKVGGVWKYYRDGEHVKATKLIKHSGCWYYVVNGVVDFKYAGFVNFNGEKYFVQNGKIISNTTGLVKCNGVWYYVVKGKLAAKTTTLVKYYGEWFYVVGGKVASGTTTLVNFNGGWYYMVKGKLAAKTTTLVKYNGNWYYVQNGKVNFSYTGSFLYNGRNYQIRKGRLV